MNKRESIEGIKDIRYLIMEIYSNKEPLNESIKKTRDCFFHYCDVIKQDLDRLEKLENAIEILKDNIYFEFNDEYTYIYLKRDKYDECDYTIIHPNKDQYELLKGVLDND